MTPETEKLEDAINRVQKHLDEHGCFLLADIKLIKQAARRYAEVLPLLGEMAKQKTPEELGEDFEGEFIEGYESMVLTARKIAAIVARDEERKQSDE